VDKAWKAYERWVAKLFNTTRIPVLGKEDADVIGEGFWIDCKLRQEVPRTWFKAMSAAETLGYNLLVYHDIVIMRAVMTLGLLHGRVAEQHVRYRAEFSDKPLEWLSHITQTCPEDRVAAVVMNTPRANHLTSLFIADADRWLYYRNSLALQAERPAFMPSARENQGG
jgi:hypothetical protein